MRTAFIWLIGLAMAASLGSACAPECRSQALTECADSVVYWTDSCGLREDAIEVCGCGCNPLRTACDDCTCQPTCEGRQCGPDGCDGLCGPGCQAGQVCTAAGQCQACQPACGGKQCGPDGCGGLCGPGCQAGESCNAFGQCVVCQPACQERECGPDGCGGQCDPGCGPSEACDAAGQCQSVACSSGSQTVISGSLRTGVAELAFDQAQVTLWHKRDVDEWEDGCITRIEIELTRGAGCRLLVAADGRYSASGGLQVSSAVFSADSFCPNFPDPTEGRYLGIDRLRLAEIIPGVTEVPGYNLAESCLATSVSVLLEGELLRESDGAPLTISASQITVTGEFASSGDPAATCPCLPACEGRACGPDGCGGECGACQASERCTSAGQCQAPGANTCWTGSDFRAKTVPGPGDLIVTELMADPEVVPDADGEWFEVLVARDLDLNGLSWGRDAGSASIAVPEGDCRPATAGDLLLMARRADSQVNGGLPAPDGIVPFQLTNTNGALWLGFYGQTIDQVTWAQAQSGLAANLDPSGFDAQRNDDPRYWCPAVQIYGAGDLGTPGTANDSCGLPQFECTVDGQPRPKRLPDVGDLVISELMPDPNWVADAQGEWFEVVVRADLDLNGLLVGRDSLSLLAVPEGECVAAAAGSVLLFARDADPARNGALPPVDGLFDFNLLNAGGQLMVGIEGLLIDRIGYPASSAGVAHSLDPDHLDADRNDLAANWCDATGAYNPGGDLGSPGALNPQCP